MQVFSLPFIFLNLFTISNYFTPSYYLGEAFSHLPFIFSSLSLATYVIFRAITGKKIFYFNISILFLLLIYINSAISTYFISVDFEHSKKIFENFTKAILLFLLIFHVLTNIKEYKAYLFILSVCAFGIAYKLIHYPIWHSGRAWLVGSSLVGDPNDLTALFIYSLPLTITLLLLSGRIWIKIVFAYMILMLLLGIVEAQSRGGLIALIVSAVTFIKQIENKQHRLKVILFSIPFISLFLYRYVTPAYVGRMYEIVSPESDVTGSAEHRARAMLLAFKYVVSHPFSEYGVGNHSYYLAEQLGYDWAASSDIFRGSYLVHNIFLQFGADVGLIPLLFYLLFIVSLFVSLNKAQKILAANQSHESAQLIWVVKALRISLYGFLAGAFFLPWAYRFYLFYLGGLCAALHKIVKEHYDIVGEG